MHIALSAAFDLLLTVVGNGAMKIFEAYSHLRNVAPRCWKVRKGYLTGVAKGAKNSNSERSDLRFEA
jgi:hypothetical protein